MVLVNLFLGLRVFLYIVIILYHAVNMVMGVIFIFVLTYISCLLIFPPEYAQKGGDMAGVLNLFMHPCQVYLASG